MACIIHIEIVKCFIKLFIITRTTLQKEKKSENKNKN
uniref:Uncharacterized protein n=1 Tax=Triticum urartu TaxID=4572 RepID=A0A8R7UJF0_TRIUA